MAKKVNSSTLLKLAFKHDVIEFTMLKGASGYEDIDGEGYVAHSSTVSIFQNNEFIKHLSSVSTRDLDNSLLISYTVEIENRATSFLCPFPQKPKPSFLLIAPVWGDQGFIGFPSHYLLSTDASVSGHLRRATPVVLRYASQDSVPRLSFVSHIPTNEPTRYYVL